MGEGSARRIDCVSTCRGAQQGRRQEAGVLEQLQWFGLSKGSVQLGTNSSPRARWALAGAAAEGQPKSGPQHHVAVQDEQLRGESN